MRQRRQCVFGFIKKLTKGDGELALERLETEGYSTPPEVRYAISLLALFGANGMQNPALRELVFFGTSLDLGTVSTIIESLQKARQKLLVLAQDEIAIRRRMGLLQSGMVTSTMGLKASSMDWLTVFAVCPIRPDLRERAQTLWEGYAEALRGNAEAMTGVANDLRSEAQAMAEWGYADPLLASIDPARLGSLMQPAIARL
jgi:hypothetical protein